MKKSQSSDYFNRLVKSLGADEEGNLTVKPTAEYHFANGVIRSYGTFKGNSDVHLLGLEEDGGNYNAIGLGWFAHENQEVVDLYMTGFDFYNSDIMRFSLKADKTVEAVSYAKSTNTQG